MIFKASILVSSIEGANLYGPSKKNSSIVYMGGMAFPGNFLRSTTAVQAAFIGFLYFVFLTLQVKEDYNLFSTFFVL